MKISTKPTLVGKLTIASATLVVLCLGSISLRAAESTSERPSYVGSDKCKLCHSKVYEEWTSTVHSKLLETNASDAGKGCESCHGPGSAHVASTGKKPLLNASADKLKDFDAVCASCHAASANNTAPKDWQKLDARYWARSRHSSKGVACLGCHTAHSSAAKLLKQEPAALCLGCHGGVLKQSGKPAAYTHSPVAQKQCLQCHNPHGSSRPQMVVAGIQGVCAGCHKSTADLTKKHSGYDVGAANCIDCHDAHAHDKGKALIRTRQHGPFKSRNCATCHKAPDAAGSAALLKPQKELCISCHSKGLPETVGAHKPVAEGMCTGCHSPHASSSDKGLIKTSRPADACFSCHSKIQSSAETAKFPHKPMEDYDCAQCHKPHASAEDGLLKKASIDLCKDCHKPHLHPYGKKPDGSVVLDPTTKKMLTCASCHEPHGSQWQYLTKDNYERELCVLCHKEGMGH